MTKVGTGMASPDFLSRDEKIRLLVNLLELTQAGQLVWADVYVKEAADPDDKEPKRTDVFMATLSATFGFLLSSVDHDGFSPFQLDIYRSKRNESVTSIRVTPLDEDGDQHINELLTDLYGEAFRRVRRPDEVIRELFQALNKARNEPPQANR
jgi:hypothetical protein